MDYVKSFFVGVASIVLALWCVLAIVFVLGLMFSAGDIWNHTWFWVKIVALLPWGALVIFVITIMGEDMRKGN